MNRMILNDGMLIWRIYCCLPTSILEKEYCLGIFGFSPERFPTKWTFIKYFDYFDRDLKPKLKVKIRAKEEFKKTLYETLGENNLNVQLIDNLIIVLRNDLRRKLQYSDKSLGALTKKEMEKRFDQCKERYDGNSLKRLIDMLENTKSDASGYTGIIDCLWQVFYFAVFRELYTPREQKTIQDHIDEYYRAIGKFYNYLCQDVVGKVMSLATDGNVVALVELGILYVNNSLAVNSTNQDAYNCFIMAAREINDGQYYSRAYFYLAVLVLCDKGEIEQFSTYNHNQKIKRAAEYCFQGIKSDSEYAPIYSLLAMIHNTEGYVFSNDQLELLKEKMQVDNVDYEQILTFAAERNVENAYWGLLKYYAEKLEETTDEAFFFKIMEVLYRACKDFSSWAFINLGYIFSSKRLKVFVRGDIDAFILVNYKPTDDYCNLNDAKKYFLASLSSCYKGHPLAAIAGIYLMRYCWEILEKKDIELINSVKENIKDKELMNKYMYELVKMESKFKH